MTDFKCPSPLSMDVVNFVKMHGLSMPVTLHFTPVDPRYLGDYCHINAKDKAKSGGRRVHGWALWEYPGGEIQGNFHSVWEDEDGKLVDVTPPKFGSKVLFIRDDTLKISRKDNMHLVYHNITNIPDARIITLDRQPTLQSQCYLRDTQTTFDYCMSLGWPDHSMV